MSNNYAEIETKLVFRLLMVK